MPVSVVQGSALMAHTQGVALGLDLNFAAGRYDRARVRYSSFGAVPGAAFARTGAGTAQTLAGVIQPFATGVLRVTDRGALFEGARTNLLLNSAAPATQSVTTTATAYTLSFYGSGAVALTGTSTAGPLIGTGAGDRVALTFTPTAGTLTLTITGSVSTAQLEAGAFATSPIITTGAAATRSLDSYTLAYTPTLPVTVFWEGSLGLGTFADAVRLDDGTSSNRVVLYRSGANGNLVAEINSGGGGTTTILGTAAVDQPVKVAFTVTPTGLSCVRAGGSAVPLVRAVGSLTRIASSASILNSYAKRLAIYPYAMTTAQMQALTA